MKKSNRVLLSWVVLGLSLVAISRLAQAQSDEREHSAEQIEALEKGGDLTDAASTARPAKLPDLTKGQSAGERLPQNSWHLGPTGAIGYMPGGLAGDQIEVTSVFKGSPADGKLQWGDVIVGVNGQNFVAGQNMGLVLGNAIIEAEREVNAGQLKLRVWRDANFLKRNASKDVKIVDVDKLIDEASSDISLYDWKSDGQRQQEVRNENFKQFPIEGQVIEVTLSLAVMPEYSDSSPYDCPKAQRILENAWKVLETQFTPDERGRGGRGGSLQAIALIASGKPEHRKLVHDWLRSPSCKVWQPPKGEDDPLRIPDKCWNVSFEGLECALYFDATGDEYVLPALERNAMRAALGQSGAGSWGHNWAQPSFNGGAYHGMNPGYGAVNTTGNRLFFLLVLARKLGVEHPEIDRAIERSTRFFSSYIDKGAIPYGHHGAAATDDSNGKNAGVALALNVLGDKYGARYFAQMSTHASFTRRGGHGHDWFWHTSPWAATLCGPRGTIANHRNMRWWFTLCRRFDGGFVIHSPTGSKDLRDATATYVLHYSAPLKQTLITGKDADESLWWTDKEFAQLLTIAKGQFSDPSLIEQAGPSVEQRSTDEVFDFLTIFMPKARASFAQELAKRYKAGEKEILPRLAALLESDNARLREAGCVGLAACGADATIQYLSAVARLLEDEAEFVRMQAAATMGLVSGTPEVKLALLKATVAEDMSRTMSPNSLPTITQLVLFGDDSKLATTPFDSGLDPKLVELALEKLITLDPTGNRSLISSRQKVWKGTTVAHVAGPLIFAAEQEQIADQMFSHRRPVSIALLEKLGYQEAIDASASYLRRYEAIPRDIRPLVDYKRGIVKGDVLMRHPAAARRYLDGLKLWLADKPLALAFSSKEEPTIHLYELLAAIQSAKPTADLPRLEDEARKLFDAELATAGDDAAKGSMCRAALAQRDRQDYFRKLEAMDQLARIDGAAAMEQVIAYLDHEHWRLRERAGVLALELSAAGGEGALIGAFASASEERASAILHVLGQSRTDAARLQIEKALSDGRAMVRGAAVEAMMACDGDRAMDRALAELRKAEAAVVLRSCERALLLQRKDQAYVDRLRTQLMAMAAEGSAMVRESVYWLVGQLGGAEGVAFLEKAAATEDEAEFGWVVNALSYCPDPQADQAMIRIIRANLKTDRAKLAARQGVRRMVIGQDDIGNRPVKEQLDYAQAVLEMELDEQTIAYLGRIRTGRCAFILQRAMRNGAPSSAAQAIIAATRDLADAPEADRKLAVAALIDTIEFIEVTYLRGGATEQDWKTYPMWKAISAEAGKNLLKLNQTEKAPLPEFNDADLDL